MEDSGRISGKLDDANMVELKAKITVVVVSVLFLVMFFIFILHVYIKWFWDRRREQLVASNAAADRRRSDNFTPGYQELAALRRGLDPSMLKTIPLVVFTSKHCKDGFECSVCLCQLIEGEKARFLPKCNHGFHVECIDMWFQSHSSCPICRNLISNQSDLSPESTLESNSVLETENSQNNTISETHLPSSESTPNFPTNVLFWGNDFEVRTLGTYMEEGQQVLNINQQLVSGLSSSLPSSSSSRLNGGAMVIDVPQHVDEDEEAISPAQTRFRSLKRFLSKDKSNDKDTTKIHD